jgi:Holliday junction resolvasome RuvABC DNA-binding subunit
MINTLTGTIIPDDSGAGFITLEVGNVGYMVHVVARTSHPSIVIRHPQRKFYIHENLALAKMGPSKYDLYGFETEVERELFRAMLKNCDRVGPAAAMRAMNIAPPQQLLQAIRLGNTKYFERGVGEKTAQQIVLGMGRWAANEAGLA